MKDVRFSLRERLIASQIWMRLRLPGSLAFALWCLFATMEFSLAVLSSPKIILLLLVTIPAAGLLAIITAPSAAYFLFSDLVDWQSRKNGAPFTVGDRVVIIPGQHSGRSATITSLGQCQSLRVTIDGDETEICGYSHHQLKRAAEPSTTPC
ncbi:MAG: hypothetical protein KDA91_05225 [Planctomycetaceae bacterium]|nr:hypothetical protein [Planctomycetaceae bacterium]